MAHQHTERTQPATDRPETPLVPQETTAVQDLRPDVGVTVPQLPPFLNGAALLSFQSTVGNRATADLLAANGVANGTVTETAAKPAVVPAADKPVDKPDGKTTDQPAASTDQEPPPIVAKGEPAADRPASNGAPAVTPVTQVKPSTPAGRGTAPAPAPTFQPAAATRPKPPAAKPAQRAAAAKRAAAPAGGARSGGGGGGGSRAGGGGSDPLSRWKSSVSAATAAVPAPDLKDAAAAPGKLSAHADAVDSQRKGERGDPAAEVKARVKTPPQEPAREKTLDTAAADTAVASVERATASKLPDQTFPATQPVPAYAGGGGGGGGSGPATTPATGTSQTSVGSANAGNVPVDPKADQVKGKVQGTAPTTASQGPAAPVTLQDPGAAPLTPPAPGKGEQIGDVLARVKKDATKYAQDFVDTGAQKVDPRKEVAAVTTMATSAKPPQETAINTEIDGVAASAGISAEVLATKVTEQQNAATAEGVAIANELAAKGAQAREQVAQRGEQDTKAISGAKAAADADVDSRQQAASGEPDTAAVEAARDAFLAKVEQAKAAGAAAYKAAAETRIADLTKVGNEQKSAYRRNAQTEAARIKGLFPSDDTKGKIEARPVQTWSDQRCLEVDGLVARYTREINAEVARLQAVLATAATASREQIRDWAAAKQGRQRSWWDRLLDMFKDWANQSKADTKAWEAQRNAQTRDAVAGDFDMLVNLRDQMQKGNKEAIAAQMAKLTDAQKAVVGEFLKSGGKDPIGAVAAGLISRLKTRRVPEISKEIEEKAIAEFAWEDLNALGRSQSPGFDAGIIVRDVRGSVKGWGTDEKRLFTALAGRTPIQVAALKKAYAATYPGRSMEDDIHDDVEDSERERADALMSGDPTAAAVATLNDAMSGAGTDEATVMQTLRGKSPAERDAIMAAYQEKYGVDLSARLADDLSGNELDQANALLAGDTAKADAMALREAMDGAGTDEAAISATYSQIRAEVEADARAKGMSTAEVEAEIRRRNQAVKDAYGTGLTGGGLDSDLTDDLSGGELKLAQAEQAYDETAMDAAKVQIEHEGFYTDDDKVNAVLRNQHDRAKRDVMRDLEVGFNEDPANRDLTPAERKAKWEKLQSEADSKISDRAKQNMSNLQAKYDANNPEWGPGAFTAVIELELSGYSKDEAHDLIKQGGKLSDAQEMKYAIFGEGTKEETIRNTLKGKSKEEVEALKKQYKELTGNDLVDDLEGDLGGRDWADAKFMLNGTKSPEEMLAYLKARKDWELGDGTGVLGSLFEDEEADVLEATYKEAQSSYAKYQALVASGASPEEIEAAKERFERWSGYGDKDIEEHRAAVDSITDTLATVAAVAAGITVTVLSGGVLGPVVAGVAATLGTSTVVAGAVVGAVAATAASIMTRYLGKGGAYSGEDLAVDLAQGAVESVVAAATAGIGAKAIEALMKSPAFAAVAKAAENGVLGKMTMKGFESAIEGAIGGLPSGMAGAILNESTWASADPLGVIMNAGATGSAMGAGAGFVIGGAMEGYSQYKGGGAAGVHGEGAAGAGDAGPVDTGPVDAGPVESGEPHIDAGDVHPGSSDGPVDTGPVDAPETRVDTGETPVDTGPVETDAPAQTNEPAPTPKAADEPSVDFDDTPTLEMDRPTLVDEIVDKMPDQTVMQSSDPTSLDDAKLMFENSMKEDGFREAAIYRNPETGEYIVIQGSETTVEVAPGEAPNAGVEQRWKEILNGGDVGRWELVAHNHPNNPATGVVDPVNMLPSGANGDMGVVVHEAQVSGQPRSSEIHYTTANGPEQTRFGFDPTAEKPFWVDLPDGAGGRTVERFGSIQEYHDFMAGKGAPQGDIPDHFGKPGTETDTGPDTVPDTEPDTVRDPAPDTVPEPRPAPTPEAADANTPKNTVEPVPETDVTPSGDVPAPSANERQAAIEDLQTRAKAKQAELTEQIRELEASKRQNQERIIEINKEVTKRGVRLKDLTNEAALSRMPEDIQLLAQERAGLIEDSALLSHRSGQAQRERAKWERAASSDIVRERYAELRRHTPDDIARTRVRAEPVDVTGKAPTSTNPLRPDHIVSVMDIVAMDNFVMLPDPVALEILNLPENLVALNASANSSKSDWSWSDWPQALAHAPADVRARMIAEEARLRQQIYDLIQLRFAQTRSQ